MIVKSYMFKEKVPFLNKALDAYALRQRTISKNIANVSSTDYKPQNVKFEEYFDEQNTEIKGNTTISEHFKLGEDKTHEVKGNAEERELPQAEVYFTGESHVNIDREMADLAENQIRFRFASRALKKYFEAINSSITGFSR